MIYTIKLWLGGIITGLFVAVGAYLYKSGGDNATRKIKDEDYENAENIRRRVVLNRDDELRKHDDAGWRDK